MTTDQCARMTAQEVNALCRGKKTAAAFFDYAPRGLEGVLLLFDKLRADGWLCLVLFDERYRGRPVAGEHACRVSRDELKDMEEVDLFFVLDDAAYAYPENSRVVAMFHSIDLEMARPGMARHLDGFCQPSRFADYLLIPYANMAELDQTTLETLFTGIYPPEMQLRNRTFTLIPCGYPNIEALAERTRGIVPDALVYAPTAGFVDGCLNVAERMVELLTSSFPDRTVIYRPHPKDVDAPENRKIVERFGSNPLFAYDREPTNRTALGRALVLLTDTSGIALTFCGARSRPVVYADLNPGPERLEAIALGFDAHGEQAVVRAVSALLKDPDGKAQQIARAMEERLFNPNRACTYLAEMIDPLRTGEEVDGWVCMEPRTLDIDCSPQGITRHVEHQLARLTDEPAEDDAALYRAVCARYFGAEESEHWDFTRLCLDRGVNLAGLAHIVDHYSRRYFGEEHLGAVRWLLRQIYCIPNGYVLESGAWRRMAAEEEVALFLDGPEPFAILGADDAYREYYRGPLLRFRPDSFVGFLDDEALARGNSLVDGFPVLPEVAPPDVRSYFLASYDQPGAVRRLERLIAEEA